ncbi:leptin precursor [Anas platyrhynchos]|uniref:Leptin n=1 Tax=Anas platyrhynchos TaxID=8839 RepID=A0A0S4FT87_ANAPL|nr:leptin precursor [Anas platyrhynchos]CEO43666.1 TPA: hypothetical protein [Anas platyrhynchos]
MWYHSAWLWGLLWLCPPPAGGRPVRPEKIWGDTRSLARTLSARIQLLQLFPLGPRVLGLEAMPGARPPEGLGAMEQRLQLFQRVLRALPGAAAPPPQILSDLENLRSLLTALAAQLGCGPPPRQTEAPPPGLAELLAQAPHTVAGLAMGRLRACLDGIAARIDAAPPC